MARWVRCPRDGHVWPTDSTLTKVTCPSCYYKLNVLENTITDEQAQNALDMEHFNLDENGVKINDKSLATEHSPRGRILDIYFKDKKAWCEYDDSFDCKHVEYALSLPVVQAILKKKGWKLP
jgi:hypothetical protein